MTSPMSFSSYYANLEKSIKDSSMDDPFGLISNNLKTLSSFKTEDGQINHLLFSKDGEIKLDEGVGSFNLRRKFNRHLIKYSSDSDNLKNVEVFTKFVNHFFKNKIGTMDKQRALIYHTMLKSSESSLENLQRLYHQEKLTDEEGSINRCLKSLTKSKTIIEEKLDLKELSVGETLEKHLKALKEDEKLTDGQKILLLQNKIDSLVYIAPNQKMKTKEVREIVKETEKEIKNIKEKLQALILKKPNASESKQYANLLERQEALQTNPQYLEAKELLAVYKHQEKDLSDWFNQAPNKDYKEFVDRLPVFRKEEEQSYLLNELILKKPTLNELEDLEKELKQQPANSTPTEIKQHQRALIEKSKIFSGSTSLIQGNKEAKYASLTTMDEKISVGWTVGGATAKFIAAGGITALIIAFPKAVIAAPVVSYLSKSAVNDIRELWKSKNRDEQQTIQKEMKQLIREIKNNPQEAFKALQQSYQKNNLESEKAIELIKWIQQTPADFSDFDSVKDYSTQLFNKIQ
jgi:hypothetical protein